MSTILLLVLSNVFHDLRLVWAMKYGTTGRSGSDPGLVGDCVARNYCLAVPANRLRLCPFLGIPTKIIQEVITITVFIGFAILFLKEKLSWNHLVAFAFLGVAAFFAFAFKAPRPGALNNPASTREEPHYGVTGCILYYPTFLITGMRSVFLVVFLTTFGAPSRTKRFCWGPGSSLGKAAGSLWEPMVAGTAACFLGGSLCLLARDGAWAKAAWKEFTGSISRPKG